MPRAGRVIIDPAKLRYHREANGFDRDDLALLVHVSVESLRSYEKGRRCPSAGVFRRIVVALGIAEEDLLHEGMRYIRKTEKEED